MHPTKIVFIGAGSASFGLGTLATLIREPALDGSSLYLVDLDEEGAALIQRLAERMATEWGRALTIESGRDRREALPGADFVVVAIETGPREALWQQDYEISLAFGLRQPYAENGGPGGFAHTLRNIPPMLDIARDMEALCPDALLINLTNPLPRLCRAVTRYTDVRAVGLCHQIYYGYALLGQLFATELEIELPPVLTNGAPYGLIAAAGRAGYHDLVRRAMEKVALRSGGLNHFIWALQIRERETGRDLYPLLPDMWARMPDSFEPLAREIYQLLGLLPIAGDTHFVEYLPWVTNARYAAWDRYRIELYHWSQAAGQRDEMWRRITQMVAGEEAIDELRQAQSEGVIELITGIGADENRYMDAVNIPNQGHITNLPPGTIVEVPGLVTAHGVDGMAVGDLPAPVAELCRREAALVEMVVEAGVTGDRELALRALLYDPHVDDIQLARDLLDSYLCEQAEWLPQFHGRWSWH